MGPDLQQSELIQQHKHVQNLFSAPFLLFQVATIVGGMAAPKQERILKKCPEIVVATPGRLWELVQQVGMYHNFLWDVIENVALMAIIEATTMVPYL